MYVQEGEESEFDDPIMAAIAESSSEEEEEEEEDEESITAPSEMDTDTVYLHRM